MGGGGDKTDGSLFRATRDGFAGTAELTSPWSWFACPLRYLSTAGVCPSLAAASACSCLPFP